MQVQTQQLPVYALTPDATGIRNFRVYNFEGRLPDHSDLLIPHRKDHYLIAFIRHARTRQWVDMTPYEIRDNTIYFFGPNEVIVKEETQEIWSTGIAFTKEFLSFQDNDSLSKLPILQNPYGGHELALSIDDIKFVEDTLARINTEYKQRSEWQQRMLSAHLIVLLTYLSRLYNEQFRENASEDKLLLQKFQAIIEQYFLEQHEVADYASLLNITPGHLSEVVKLQSGKPAIKHIHERLVLEAKRLLFHTDNSSKEISFELGFNDSSYFNRFFKRETGATPTEYRSSIRKMYH